MTTPADDPLGRVMDEVMADDVTSRGPELPVPGAEAWFLADVEGRPSPPPDDSWRPDQTDLYLELLEVLVWEDAWQSAAGAGPTQTYVVAQRDWTWWIGVGFAAALVGYFAVRNRRRGR